MALSRDKRESLLRRYRTRLEFSRRWREDEGYDALWERLIDLYAGKHFPQGLSNEDRIAVNLAFATVNVIGPSVAVNHPKITVQARQPEDEDRAVILETAINYWWRHFKFQPEIRLAVKDYLVIGHGWLKCGYRFVEEEVDRPEEEVQADFVRQREEADGYAAEHPEFAAEMPTDDDIMASVEYTTTRVAEDRPFAERVAPRDIFVDPEATHPNNMKWIAQRVVRTLDEVRSDKRYKANVRNKVESDTEVPERWLGRTPKRKYGDDIKRVTVWEMYDVQAGTMCVFTDGGEDFLVPPRPQPYTFGHPFRMLRNYDVTDRFYPIGDLEALEPLQQELDKTRSQMMNARKRYVPKYLYRKDAFDKRAEGDLASDVPNTMVPVIGNLPLTDVVQPLEISLVPPDFYNQSDIITNDINAVSGVNEYSRGQLPEIRRTATEASIIQDASNARAADKLSQIEGLIGEIAANLVALAQQYLTGEQVVRIMGANGAPIWVPFSRDDIVGEYDFEVEGGSTQPQNETFRRQTTMQMLNTLSPFMGPEGSGAPLDARAVLAHALRYGFGVKNPEQFMSQVEPLLVDATQEGGEQAGLPPGPLGGGPNPTGGAADDALGPQGVPPQIAAQLAEQVGVDFG